MHKNIKRIILEYVINDIKDIFITIDRIDVLTWYLNIFNITKDKIIAMKALQISYLNRHLKIALWLNRKFKLTFKNRIIYCHLYENDFSDGQNIDPLSRDNKKFKGMEKLIGELNYMHELGWDINVDPKDYWQM